MLNIPQEILDRAGSRNAVDPAMWLDIYADRGPSVQIDQAYSWKGASDPDVVFDVNVDFNRRPGSVTLAPGKTVEPSSTFLEPLWSLNTGGDFKGATEHAGAIYRILGGIQRSTDGVNFTQVLTGYAQIMTYSTAIGFIAIGLSVNTYYIYISTDGINWVFRGNPPLTGGSVTGIAYAAGRYFVSTNSGAIYYSVDAVNWIFSTDLGSYCFGIFANGANIISYGQNSVYSVDNGVTWKAMAVPYDLSLSAVIHIAGKWIARGGKGALYISYNSGATWSGILTPASGLIVSIKFINGIYFATTDAGEVIQSVDGLLWEIGKSAGAIGFFGNIFNLGTAYYIGTSTGLYSKLVNKSPSKQWSVNWRGRIIDHYHHKRNWKGKRVYVHDSWEYVNDVTEPGKKFNFTSQATVIADKLVVLVKHQGNINPECFARFMDAAGNQVGKRVSFSISSAAWTDITLIGFSAALVRSSKYTLEIGYTAPNIHALTPYAGTTVTYAATLSFGAFAVMKSPWHLRIAGGGIGFALGGQEGFADAGSLIRSLDVGELPVTDGVAEIIDIIPVGTTANITLWHTDNQAIAQANGTANMTLLGTFSTESAPMQALPASRFWKFKLEMTANSANDIAPEIGKVGVGFRLPPTVVGTHSTTIGKEIYTGFKLPLRLPLRPTIFKRSRKGGVRALSSIRISPSQLTPKIGKTMIGRATAVLMADHEIDDLMSKKLRGADVSIRFGYADIESSVVVYQGIILDMSYSSGKYTLIIQDPLDLSDVKIPNAKYTVWNNIKAYNVGEIVVFGTDAWKAQAGNTGIKPGTDATKWLKSGAVWMPIEYTSATNGGAEWHLADIVRDILTNRVNVPASRIDFAALEGIKARLPLRTGSRLVSTPTSVLGMLGELAFLLESQFAIREGKVSLIAEPLPTDLPTEQITDNDIAPGVKYRRGWGDLKNGTLILSAWDGKGNSSSNYADGEAIFNASSINDYKVVVMDEFQDKWNVPQDELKLIGTNHINRYKDGRRIVQCDSTLRLLRVEPGTMVQFESSELPIGDKGPFKMIVMAKDLLWESQKLRMTLREV